MRSAVYFGLLLIGILAPVTRAGADDFADDRTFHLINVANVADPKLGREFQNNAAAVAAFAGSAAGYTQMKMHEVPVTDTYSCAAILKAVRDLRVDKDDVVMFFHSGHGVSPKAGRNDETESNFPVLQCTETNETAGPKLEDIANVIAAKKPRLTIVISDSCNVFVEEPPAEQDRGLSKSEKTFTPPVKEFMAMFRGTTGRLLLTAAQPGKYAFYKIRDLGMFTTQFLRAAGQPKTDGQYATLWDRVVSGSTRLIEVPKQMKLPPNINQTTQQPLAKPDLHFVNGYVPSDHLPDRPAGAVASKLQTLHPGDKGDDVKRLQAALAKRGYADVPQDGVYDNRTAGAVKDLQTKSDIADDSVVGPDTWKLLLAIR